ncbi:snf2 family protein [Clostridium sp. CAG:81]|nr:snf2 family protein [Clostridium sp. CAG:81]
MNRVIIWVLNAIENSEFIDIEVYEGINKYTKTGIFSGPLRTLNLEKREDYERVEKMLPIKKVTQIGKNKYRIYKEDIKIVCENWKEQNINSVYYRLPDKKLHHINGFVTRMNNAETKDCVYNKKSGELEYNGFIRNNNCEIDEQIITVPEAKLYLYSSKKQIEAYLNFSYQGIEVPANLRLENIQGEEGTLFRNLRYERYVKEELQLCGGRKGKDNEIIFPAQKFFSKILPELFKIDVNLFWGKERKHISKSGVSCRISYGMEWFNVTGEVKEGDITYKLSDLLRASKGKDYVEINNNILFLPDELKKLAVYPTENENIKVPTRDLAEVNDIAERFQLDPSIYLKQFMHANLSGCEIDINVHANLKPFQKEGVIWLNNMYRSGLGCCLADDMGLGKTLQSIAFICSRKKKTDAPILIVVPKVILYNWESEIRHFAPGKKYIVVYGKYDYSTVMEKEYIYITTYETVVNNISYFKKEKYDIVILDEAHKLNNQATQKYKILTEINAGFVLALTGTPIENNIAELWSLLNMLNPRLFGRQSEFIHKYGDIHENTESMERLRTMISPFILRRTKKEVLKELPDKIEKNIYCIMGEKQRHSYEILLSAIQNELKEKPTRYTIKDNAAILQSLLYLREFCSDPKLLPPGMGEIDSSDSCKFEMFCEYAQTIVNESGKLIVYSMFPRVLKSLKQWCEDQKWRTFYIDGATENRQNIVEQFEHEPQGVFFISLKAGGVGLNLVSCQNVIIYDPWWNAAAEEQAADRVYRIGQNKTVFIYHFLIKDSIEERIYELQNKKKLLAKSALDGMEKGKNISEEIYKLLF